jgi:cardiolipin synthase (CMP-forming)
LTVRRLLGLDRSGPEPPETRAGAPLRPFTLPNLLGYARLAAIPVFLYLALDSGDGRTATASAIYFAIVVGDYVDGFLARATGQYSRLGALLDPVVDRLAILAGAVVCWQFSLLPRWALAVLAGREIVTAALAQIALRRGVDVEINWVGRVAVFPIMGGLFWATVLESWFPEVLLYIGLVGAIFATLLYVRMGLARGR